MSETAPEQVVKIVDLDQSIKTVVATSDLSRAFVAVLPSESPAKPGAVWVIDGVRLAKADADPSTPALDPIVLLYDQTPTAMALDPKGRYLYVTATSAVFVIDIDPGSPTLHKIVDTITVPTTTGRFLGAAVNADGTRLYLTAPKTELFGSRDTAPKGWTSGGRETGNVIVLNVDDGDRPAPSATNTRKWRQVIGTLDGGLEPYGIEATAFADKMIFTSRLRGGPNSSFGGLQTITVTNDDPLSYAASVKSIDLRLSNNQNQKYQLYIRNPVDVVVLPDLSYAFVTDWNVPLVVGGCACLIEYMEKHALGSKVGVIKNPFEATAKIVAATTPISMAFANDIALSSDGKKLYVNYSSAGDVLVFDVTNLIWKANNTPEAVRNEQFKVLDSIRPLAPTDVVRGQYRGYREVAGVAPDSDVETFAALRLHVDTWRWSGVPFYIRTGKCLPVTATEVLVELKRPPQSVFREPQPRDADYLRFRLSPDMSISLGARAKRPGEAMVGEAVELYAAHQSGTEQPPYQRLIGDAVRGDQSLFAREDAVEAAWRAVDGVLRAGAQPHVYEPGTWGPPEAANVLLRGDHWHNPAAGPEHPAGS